MLSDSQQEHTDELVNEVLVEIGVSSAIDQMIYRHYGGLKQMWGNIASAIRWLSFI